MTKITNKAAAVRIVNAKVDGKLRQVPIKPGETKDLDVVETPAFKARVASGQLVLGAKGEPVAKAPKAPAPTSSYAVADKGRGWFVITKDGAEVTKSLRDDDVKGFAEMSAADQAAFVEANKAE